MSEYPADVLACIELAERVHDASSLKKLSSHEMTFLRWNIRSAEKKILDWVENQRRRRSNAGVYSDPGSFIRARSAAARVPYTDAEISLEHARRAQYLVGSSFKNTTIRLS